MVAARGLHDLRSHIGVSNCQLAPLATAHSPQQRRSPPRAAMACQLVHARSLFIDLSPPQEAAALCSKACRSQAGAGPHPPTPPSTHPPTRPPAGGAARSTPLQSAPAPYNTSQGRLCTSGLAQQHENTAMQQPASWAGRQAGRRETAGGCSHGLPALQAAPAGASTRLAQLGAGAPPAQALVQVQLRGATRRGQQMMHSLRTAGGEARPAHMLAMLHRAVQLEGALGLMWACNQRPCSWLI